MKKTSINIYVYKQLVEKWACERKKRITASSCYTTFTYSKRLPVPDWDKKFQTFFYASRPDLINFQIGHKYEKDAILMYQKMMCNVSVYWYTHLAHGLVCLRMVYQLMVNVQLKLWLIK